MKKLSVNQNLGETNMGETQSQPQSNAPAFNIPTEIVDLPSKGLLYPKGSSLSKGQVEIKHMTAREEDILGTESYIKNNQVMERLLKSLMQGDVSYNDLLLGDRNAIMLAARIHGYGPEYEASIKTPSGNTQKVEIDLNEVAYVELDETRITPGQNQFKFKLPVSGIELTFKLLTVGDEKRIQRTIEERKKKSRGPKAIAGDPALSTRLEAIILQANGQEIENKSEFVSNLLARDTRAFRNHYAELQPDINLEFEFVDEETLEPFRSQVNLGPTFLYPDFEG